MNEPRRIGEIFQEVAERFQAGKSHGLREWLVARRERAQAGLERERNAYWIRKNAGKARRQEIKPGDPYEASPPNRAQVRANQGGGLIWSQRHRPARPSDTIARAQRARTEQ